MQYAACCRPANPRRYRKQTIAAAQVGIGETVRALAVVILDDVGESESRDDVSTCIGQNDPAAHMFGALGSRMPWTRIARTRQIIGTPANPREVGHAAHRTL